MLHGRRLQSAKRSGRVVRDEAAAKGGDSEVKAAVGAGARTPGSGCGSSLTGGQPAAPHIRAVALALLRLVIGCSSFSASGGGHSCSGKQETHGLFARAVRYNSRASQHSVLEGSKGEQARELSASGTVARCPGVTRSMRARQSTGAGPWPFHLALRHHPAPCARPNAPPLLQRLLPVPPCFVLPTIVGLITVGITLVLGYDVLRHARQRCQRDP